MTRQEFSMHVERSQRPLRRFLTALCCGDSALADDLAQDAYIKAYLSLDTLADEGRFDAWVTSIAYRVFLDSARSRRYTAPVDEACSAPSADRADDAFRYQDLYMALDRLSGPERAALLLYYMQGYDVHEISRALGIGESAVRQHMTRGRRHLAQFIDK